MTDLSLLSIFLRTHQAVRQASSALWDGETFARSKTAVLEDWVERLRTAYGMLPEELRVRAWMATSVERGR
jgi:hypothetical protein